MKHVDLFADFMRDTVNLNATRVTELENSVEAIEDAVEASSWEPGIQSWMPQGSWAHKTIIRPVNNNEFDADLLVFVEPVDGWTAASYIDELYFAFKETGTYREKVRRYSHCVTITYAHERKIDVAPCIVNRGGFQRLEVCNRDTGEFEPTEPRRYTEWIIQRNAYSGSNSFRKVTRLVKYLRDVKRTFTCPSVLLTTLLGYRMTAADSGSSDFADTPTALRTIFGRLDDWLQAYPSKPAVPNPYLLSEDFADSLTDEQYSNFREFVHKYRGWIDDAFNETDRNESIAKWRRVFGEEFASGVVEDTAKSVSKAAIALLRDSVSAAALFAGDLVDAIKQFGVQALPLGFNKQPHMHSPKWRIASPPSFTVEIRADLYRSKGYGFVRSVQPLEPLPPGYWLELRAVTSMGIPVGSSEIRIEWRVTNTDEAAHNARQLRGDFYDSHAGHVRWETLKFRGVHLVEAFVIRTRDDTVVAISEPFRVVIE